MREIILIFFTIALLFIAVYVFIYTFLHMVQFFIDITYNRKIDKRNKK